MNTQNLVLLAVLFLALDLFFVALRASFIYVRIPHLGSHREKDPDGVDRTLRLLETPRLTATLRVCVVFSHFLVAGTVALLAESRDQAMLCDFLAEHVLPWSGRYLELFSAAAQDSPFYRASAALANCSLNGLQAQWQIVPHQLRLRYPPTDDEMEAVQ